jgi:hypothetical protein
VAIAAQATAEKKVWTKIRHPPILGAAMAGTRVIAGEISGRCSREFAGLLERDLSQHGITVVGQGELDPLLAQHHLQTGAIPRPGSSAELAAALGPTVVISAGISRCEAHPREPLIGGGLPAMHISRTEGHFQASLRVVDFASGEEITTLAIRTDPSKENRAQTGIPEWPSAPEVIEMALAQAVAEAQHLYLPWIENRETSFMDDKNCNLRQAYDVLLKGDYPGLVAATRASAESCGSKSKAAAWYDLGIAYMLVRDFDGALSALGEAQKLKDNKAVSDAIGQCQKDKEAADAAARLILAQARQTQKQEQQDRPAAEVQTGILFTNDLVLKLVLSNVSEEYIIKMIASQPARFSLGPDDLAQLKTAGVPDAVIEAMRRKK